MNTFCSRFLVLIPIFFLFSFSLIGQNVMLSSQAEVDAFDATEIDGLTIKGDGITNINISSLTSVSGSITIDGNADLVSISFSSLEETTGRVWIINNPELTNISFPVVTRIGNPSGAGGNSLRIHNNNALLEVTTFPQLEFLGDFLIIENNENLERVEGFNNLTVVEQYDFIFRDNPSLTTIEGFNNLERVNRDFTINNNPQLTNFPTFPELGRVRNLSITNADELTSISFADLSEQLGSITIDNNDEITSISFPLVEETTGRVWLINNPELTNISFPVVTRIGNPSGAGGNSLRIHNNNALLEVTTFPQLEFLGDFLIIENNENLERVEGFNNLTVVEQYDFIFRDNPSLTTIEGFNNLERVNRDFTINNNPQLTNFPTFPELGRVRNLSITNADELTSISFADLSEQLGSITIDNNDEITSISFPLVEETTGRVWLINNPELTNISFPVVTRIGNPSGAGGNSLRIHNNNALLEVTTFPQLEFLGDFLIIENNENLERVEGFNNLTVVEQYDFIFRDNPSLTTIEGFNNLERVNRDFTINNNPQLTNFPTFPELGRVRNLSITNADELTSISFADLSEQLGSITIDNNDEITNISFPLVEETTGRVWLINNPELTNISFPVVTRIGNPSGAGGNSLRIHNNNALLEVTTFPALEFLGDFLIIENNENLERVVGFNNLTAVEQYDFIIRDNPSLLSLIGFEQLSSINRDLSILRNPNLSICCGVAPILDSQMNIGSNITIDENTTGCNTTVEIIAACANGVSQTWYADMDGDGFGDLNSSIQSTTQPDGFVLNDNDCDDNNVDAGAKQIPGIACDDGNDATENDQVQSDSCSCLGIIPMPMPCDGIGDADGDGICANEDCNDNDPSIGANQPQGTPCNDNNDLTNNDVILVDGCTCEGTPRLVPFDCSSAYYQVAEGQLGKFDVEQNAFVPIGDTHSNMNAIGYNIEDNLIYGLFGTDRRKLFRIDALGNFEDLGEVNGLPASLYAGDFDNQGNLHLLNNDNGQLLKIDVDGTELQIEELNIEGRIPEIADIAYDMNKNVFYGFSGANSSLVTIDLDNSVLSQIATQNVVQTVGFGSVYYTVEGNFYGFNNPTKEIYKIDVITGEGTLITTISENFENSVDGASCPNAMDIFGNLPPLCADNGGDSDGDGVCADEDCDDNDAEIGAKQPEGTSCDDGDVMTDNDVILADGCTCQGTDDSENQPIPFECSEKIYEARNGQLFIANSDGSDRTAIGTPVIGATALSYNQEDNLLYGFSQPSNQLVIIDANGKRFELDFIQDNLGFRSGDMDDQGNLYLVDWEVNLVYRIDVSERPLTIDTIPLNNDFPIVGDVTFNPRTNLFYGIPNGGQNLYAFNGVTGEVTILPIPNLNEVRFGATWLSDNYNLTAFASESGNLYEVNITTGESILINQNLGLGGGHEGARCALGIPNPCANNGDDTDNDGICDDTDNCPQTPNPDQLNADNDTTGAACDCDDSPETGFSCTDGCQVFYRDMDEDGFGNAMDSVMTCIAPTGYVDNKMDCDDGDSNKTLDCQSTECDFSNGLAAYYPLNGNADDISGNEINGTENGGATYGIDRFGNTGQSLNLVGNNGYVDFGDALDVGTNDFAISLWFNANTIRSSGFGSKILNKGLTFRGTPSDAGYGLRVIKENRGNVLRFFPSRSGAVDTVGIQEKVWYHVFAQRRDTSILVYVNGELIGQTKEEPVINSDTNIPLALGALHRGQFGQTTEFFDGSIDDFRFYLNRPFSDEEVRELFECEGGEIHSMPPCTEILPTQTFTSQAQLDSFVCDCNKTIQGDLIINGDDITDLSNLSCIKEVTGSVLIGDSLSIPSNDILETLNGLSGVMRIGGDLVICNNPALRNLDGFSSLMEVGGDIQVKNCLVIEYIRFVSLTSVGGSCIYWNLPTLRYIGSIEFGVFGGFGLTSFGGGVRYENLPELVWITGFGGLSEIRGDIYFVNVPKLESLEAYQSIIRLFGCLHLLQTTQIVDFAGLDSLELIGEDIRIINNDQIRDLSQLGNLVTLNGSLIIRDNDNLIDLNGLRNLASIADSLVIMDNLGLSDCCGIDDLLQNGGVNGPIMIAENLAGCLSPENINETCRDIPPVETCDFTDPLVDLRFLADIVANPDPCYLEILQGEMDGEPIFIVLNENICEVEPGIFLATELDYIVYDCAGDILCAAGLVDDPVDCRVLSIVGEVIWSKPPCVCTTEFLPVCSIDGVTYSNACEAECAGVFDYVECIIVEDEDEDGFTVAEGDCDDNNPNIYPNAAEIPCNGIDENCDGIDNSVTDEPCSTEFDCPEFMLDIGQPCDDNDPTTDNEWLEEGCICVGQVIEDCAVEISVVGNSIIVENLNYGHNKALLFDRTFSNALDTTCTFWVDCGGTQSFDNLLPGVYAVQIQTFSEDWSKLYCDFTEYIEIIGSTPTDACADLGIKLNGNDLSVTDLPTLNTIIDLFDYQYASIFRCVGDCGTGKIIKNLAEDTYFLRVKIYDNDWNFLCEIEETLEVSGTGIIPSDSESSLLGTPSNSPSSTNRLKIYPNPSSEQIQVQMHNFIGLEADLIITDVLSRRVYQKHFDKVENLLATIDIHLLDAGVYQVSVNQNGLYTTTKLIVIR